MSEKAKLLATLAFLQRSSYPDKALRIKRVKAKLKLLENR